MHTARSTAIACGIIDKKNEQPMEAKIMEGSEFRAHGNLQSLWSSVRVLARAEPADKYNLVKGIIDSNMSRNREVVAVTGGGTNDASALRKSDVGFAMVRIFGKLQKRLSQIL
jgi:magnesium-transporting ATPase (P-type)